MVEQGRGGAIVLTASVAGLNSGAGPGAYSASKAGVINLAKVAAQQLSTSGVRVDAVCPGLTETGMTKPTFDYARAQQVTHRSEKRRVGNECVSTCISRLAPYQ